MLFPSLLCMGCYHLFFFLFPFFSIPISGKIRASPQPCVGSPFAALCVCGNVAVAATLLLPPPPKNRRWQRRQLGGGGGGSLPTYSKLEPTTATKKKVLEQQKTLVLLTSLSVFQFFCNFLNSCIAEDESRVTSLTIKI